MFLTADTRIPEYMFHPSEARVSREASWRLRRSRGDGSPGCLSTPLSYPHQKNAALWSEVGLLRKGKIIINVICSRTSVHLHV